MKADNEKQFRLQSLLSGQANRVKPLVNPSQTYLDDPKNSQVATYILRSVHDVSYASAFHIVIQLLKVLSRLGIVTYLEELYSNLSLDRIRIQENLRYIGPYKPDPQDIPSRPTTWRVSQ